MSWVLAPQVAGHVFVKRAPSNVIRALCAPLSGRSAPLGAQQRYMRALSAVIRALSAVMAVIRALSNVMRALSSLVSVGVPPSPLPSPPPL